MELLHYATCLLWADAEYGFCTCPRPWRIRKDPADARHPWRIERRTDDVDYELFLRASSYAKAVDLVACLISLRRRLCRLDR